MHGKRLNAAFCNSAPAPTKQQVIHYDASGKGLYVAGFGLRITKGNARAFVLTYRAKDGTSRRYTIGKLGMWSLTAAREEARRLKIEVDKGGDPVQAAREKRHPAIRVQVVRKEARGSEPRTISIIIKE